jgi:uncharacterized protein
MPSNLPVPTPGAWSRFLPSLGSSDRGTYARVRLGLNQPGLRRRPPLWGEPGCDGTQDLWSLVCLPAPSETCRMMEDRSFEVMPEREAIALLSSMTLGRVVFTLAALPAIVPVNYAVQDHAVVIRTSQDTRLAAAADGGVLAFEVDQVDPVTRTGWSVVVTGVAEVVTNPRERAIIHGMLEPYEPGHHDVYVRLPLTVVTGRRVA